MRSQSFAEKPSVSYIQTSSFDDWPDGETEIPIAVRLGGMGSSEDEEDGHKANQACGILGKCTRNCVTGKIHLHEATARTDYAIVDLWDRPALYGSAESLAKDPYLFRIQPMPHRTWIYHQWFNDPAPPPNGVIGKVLNEKAIDALGTVRWSPSICYVISSFASCFVTDITIAFACTAVCVLLLAISELMNTPEAYRWVRPVTFVIRLAFFFYAFISMLNRMGDGGTIILGFVVMISSFIVDFVADIRSLSSYQMNCRYEVIKGLPRRVFVCHRKGAAFLKDPQWAPIAEFVTGVGAWSQSLFLIAEIRGLVCQLKPMGLEDWKEVCNQTHSTREPAQFMSLGIYNKELKTAADIDVEKSFARAKGDVKAFVANVKGALDKKSETALLE